MYHIPTHHCLNVVVSRLVEVNVYLIGRVFKVNDHNGLINC